ncbi:MAG: radical SAM protein [Cytophagales bacterium]|nr:radical SAM protein [Cytophagales bacterium]
MPKHPSRIPYLVVSDKEGNIFEDKNYEAVGASGLDIVSLQPQDFIELPDGSQLFYLPGKIPHGKNLKTGIIEVLEHRYAVAAFVSPAHTQTYLSAYIQSDKSPVLPLYAYTAIGWLHGKFYTTAVRIDEDIRQDFDQFQYLEVQKKVKKTLSKYPNNRLLQHLAHNCATEYTCRAAQNYFYGRWECPIPTSPACNAECLGCISLQPDENPINSSHFRMKFTPTVQEIVEIALPHLNLAPNPIISFGQGCEGEPLLVWEVIREAIIEIRKKTDKGIININTNGSKPEAVEALCKAGLQSIRVSMNSAQKHWYTKYYLPRNYTFEDIKESAKIVRSHRGWASINYFTCPGLTDSYEEYGALKDFINYTDINMIQWRNFNIDTHWYMKKLGIAEPLKCMGMRNLLEKLYIDYPALRYGYYNPYIESILV